MHKNKKLRSMLNSTLEKKVGYCSIVLITLTIMLFFSVNDLLSAERGIARRSNDSQQKNNSRTALIIGNGKYNKAELQNPGNDAQDIASALQNLGFDVELLIDADQMQMSKAITRFGQKLKKSGGVGLFFFAGHGMQIKGHNYLIPLNNQISEENEVPFRAIDAGLVLSKMESAGNPMNMLILDACRNNPFVSSSRSYGGGLAQMDAPKGSLIVYATSPGSTAADGHGRNGVFTKHLLANIASDLDVVIMMRKVRVGVLGETGGKQVPWSSSSLQGGFAFNKKNSYRTELHLGQHNTTLEQKNNVNSSNGFWNTSNKFGIEIDVNSEDGAYVVTFAAKGQSRSGDILSRKIASQRNALKNIKKLMRADLKNSPLKLSRSSVDSLYKSGEVIELEYYDDGKNVELSYEVVFPDQLAHKLK